MCYVLTKRVRNGREVQVLLCYPDGRAMRLTEVTRYVREIIDNPLFSAAYCRSFLARGLSYSASSGGDFWTIHKGAL